MRTKNKCLGTRCFRFNPVVMTQEPGMVARRWGGCMQRMGAACRAGVRPCSHILQLVCFLHCVRVLQHVGFRSADTQKGTSTQHKVKRAGRFASVWGGTHLILLLPVVMLRGTPQAWRFVPGIALGCFPSDLCVIQDRTIQLHKAVRWSYDAIAQYSGHYSLFSELWVTLFLLPQVLSS